MLNDKKLLVTGLTGNLGGSIAAALAPHNELWGFARYSRDGQRDFWESQGVRTVAGDLADGAFDELPADFDYVVHCAANCGPESFVQGMRDNPQGTAMLMAHCRSATAFLHISTIGVYAANTDPEHSYGETDQTGGAVMGGHYEGTKLAAEGVAWGMAKHLGLPTTVARLGVQYGTYHDGGMLGIFLGMLLAGQPIPLPAHQSNIIQPISDDDVVRFIEPLLGAAAIPPTLVNLGGDEAIATREVMEHFGKLAGIEPQFAEGGFEYPTYQLDAAKRKAITGPCQVPIREGLSRMYDVLAPRLRGK
ncbi:MAG: NAD(P)-dependent oxidoreductase [Porticoccaceae bacterium]